MSLENVMSVHLESFVTDALIVVDAKAGHNGKDRLARAYRRRVNENYSGIYDFR